MWSQVPLRQRPHQGRALTTNIKRYRSECRDFSVVPLDMKWWRFSSWQLHLVRNLPCRCFDQVPRGGLEHLPEALVRYISYQVKREPSSFEVQYCSWIPSSYCVQQESTQKQALPSDKMFRTDLQLFNQIQCTFFLTMCNPRKCVREQDSSAFMNLLFDSVCPRLFNLLFDSLFPVLFISKRLSNGLRLQQTIQSHTHTHTPHVQSTNYM